LGCESKWAAVTLPAGTPETDGTEGRPDGGQAGDRRFSEAEMAVLGGVLGALLLLALIALAVLVYKNYGHRLTCGSGRALVRLGVGAGAARWRARREGCRVGLETPQRAAGDGGAVERGQDGELGSVRQRAAWEMEGGQWSEWEMGCEARRAGWRGRAPGPQCRGQGGRAQLAAG